MEWDNESSAFPHLGLQENKEKVSNGGTMMSLPHVIEYLHAKALAKEIAYTAKRVAEGSRAAEILADYCLQNLQKDEKKYA